MQVNRLRTRTNYSLCSIVPPPGLIYNWRMRDLSSFKRNVKNQQVKRKSGGDLGAIQGPIYHYSSLFISGLGISIMRTHRGRGENVRNRSTPPQSPAFAGQLITP